MRLQKINYFIFLPAPCRYLFLSPRRRRSDSKSSDDQSPTPPCRGQISRYMDSLSAAPQPLPPATPKSHPPEATSPPSMAADSEKSDSFKGSDQISRQEDLLETFTSLVTAIRLLRLKGSASTFANVAPKVESLTKREFSRRNLAQLKFIFPEAIEVTGLDHLRVALNVDSVSKSEEKGSSPYMVLREEFSNRLADFCKHHPEDDEVPEAALLEPVHLSNQDHREVDSSLEDDALLDKLKPVAASHFEPCFHRGLSRRVMKVEFDDDDNSIQPCLDSESGFEEADCSSVCVPFLPVTPGKEKGGGFDLIQATPVKRVECATPSKRIVDDSFSKEDECQATPAKGVDLSTPSKSIYTATPALCTPKVRNLMSPDDEDSDAVESANKLKRRHHVRTRSLKFDAPVNDDVSNGKNVDLLVTLIKENERKGEEQMAMAASLPKLFNTIDSIFRSGRSVMTKDEVIHKIIAAHLEVVNRGEVEEQLKMLGEVIPEWISERTAFSGDSLFCINKLTSSAAMRARLEEAFPVKEASLGLGIAV